MLVLLPSATVVRIHSDLSETCRIIYQINMRNSAFRWLLLLKYITMHGPLNVNFDIILVLISLVFRKITLKLHSIVLSNK